MDVSINSFSCLKIFRRNNWKFVKLWIIAVCIYILLFFFVCDLYFKSPINHGLETHGGAPFTKRVVLFVADGLRQETLLKHRSVTEYLTGLRDEEKCAHGVVHTKVPTESRPGHAAILGGIYEDPSAVFSGWKSNVVEFDSVVNRSNYAWLFGSPDIVRSYEKADNWKLHVDSYTPEYQDFSGRGNVSELDQWVFGRVKTTLHNRAGSCEEEFFKLRRFQRKINFVDYATSDGDCAGLDEFVGKPYCNYQYVIRWNKNPILDRFDAKIKEVKHECAVEEVKNCAGVICESGNLFFLHLLGMDSAGHIHKPNSEKFVDTLKNLDFGVEDMVMLFEDFFNDEQTTYIFTADHGMTDWGSHGDGSEMETEVPFMIWGTGVKPSGVVLHLEQADLAPLIAILLGTSIPINSVGFLNHLILNGSKQEINRALLVNLEQLVENYNHLRNGYERDYFFRDPRFFKSRDPSGFVELFTEEINKNQSLDENVLIIKNVAGEVLKGIKYLNDYYFTPKMGTVWYGFILWNIYLVMSLHPGKETIDRVWLETFHSCRSCFYVLVGIIAAIFSGYAFCLQSSYFSYMYIAFPTITTIHFFMNDRAIYDIYKFNQRRRKGVILIRGVWLILLTEVLVFGFFNKHLYGFILCVMVFWMNSFKPTSGILQFFWFIINTSLTVCLLIPHSTSFSFEKFYIGISIWISLNIITSVIIARGSKYRALSTLVLTSFPSLLLIATAVNTYTVAIEFDDEGVSEKTRWLSWILTSVSLISIPFYPNNLLMKFNHICFALSIPYVLTSTNSDVISYTILVIWLNLWIILESKSTDIYSEHYTTKLNLQDNTLTYDNHRRSFFYIAITMTYFFAIGNLASFSGFDPLWTRAYVSTFRKNLMAALIVLKMTTPFFLITCAYSAINTVNKANVLTTFTITMIQLDQMILNFMLNIKNEGSWKEIGQSLSHFIIMEVTALILLSFYLLSLYMTGFSLCNLKTIEGAHEEEKEIQTVNLEATPTSKEQDAKNAKTSTHSVLLIDEGTNFADNVVEAGQDEKIIIISKLRSYPPKQNKLPPSFLRHRLLSVIRNPDVVTSNYADVYNDIYGDREVYLPSKARDKFSTKSASEQTGKLSEPTKEFLRDSPKRLHKKSPEREEFHERLESEYFSRKPPERLARKPAGEIPNLKHNPTNPPDGFLGKSPGEFPRNSTEGLRSSRQSPERLPKKEFPEHNLAKSPKRFVRKPEPINSPSKSTSSDLKNSNGIFVKLKAEPGDVIKLQRRPPPKNIKDSDQSIESYSNFAENDKAMHKSSSEYEADESSTDEKIKHSTGLQTKFDVKFKAKVDGSRVASRGEDKGKSKYPAGTQTNENPAFKERNTVKELNPVHVNIFPISGVAYKKLQTNRDDFSKDSDKARDFPNTVKVYNKHQIKHDFSEDIDHSTGFPNTFEVQHRINHDDSNEDFPECEHVQADHDEEFSANYPDVISQSTFKNHRNLEPDYYFTSTNSATQTHSIFFEEDETRVSSMSLENRSSRDRVAILKQFEDLFSTVSEESLTQSNS